MPSKKEVIAHVRDVRRKEACEEIVRAIADWWKEGDAPLHAGTYLLDEDKPLADVVREALDPSVEIG